MGNLNFKHGGNFVLWSCFGSSVPGLPEQLNLRQLKKKNTKNSPFWNYQLNKLCPAKVQFALCATVHGVLFPRNRLLIAARSSRLKIRTSRAEKNKTTESSTVPAGSSGRGRFVICFGS